ncbi:MAG TPA: hypothetical protein VEV16_11555 [Daejeonella sp.]|nr:hypothetical protein [Daejeonella sp.]
MKTKNSKLRAIRLYAIALLSFGMFFSINGKAAGIEIVQDTIKPYKAKETTPTKAKEIEVYKSKEITPDKPRDLKADQSKRVNNPVSASSKTDLDFFFGVYHYWVPGTSYTIPDYSNNQLVLRNSAGTGVLPGDLRINSDGTYIWNSSDGKIIRGNWINSNNKDYPLELIKAQEGKNWKIGKSDQPNSDILIWDGYTWYNGKKIKTAK